MAAIDWLVCTADSVAEAMGSEIEAAAEGCLDAEAGPLLRLLAFLSPAERETLATLRFPKRRREWLLGRWTAKQLLRRARPEYAALSLDAITVGNDPDGVPYLTVAGQGRLPLSLSISHRDDRSFCALLSLSPSAAAVGRTFTQAAVGADIERVEPRDPAFVNDFFTTAEAERVWRCPQEARDMLVTVLWSAKEAVLKVLRLGLTVDTRRVEILHVADLEPPADGAAGPSGPGGWPEVEIHCTLPDTAPLCAWWRPEGRYVLTLATFAHPGTTLYPSP